MIWDSFECVEEMLGAKLVLSVRMGLQSREDVNRFNDWGY